MKKVLISALFLLLAVGWAHADEGPNVLLSIIEKNASELQSIGTVKTILAGELLKGGWQVLDINAYPATLSGEDLGVYLAQKGVKPNEYKSKDLSASISPEGTIKLITKDIYSLNDADLRRMNWHLDAEKLQALTKSAGAKYLLYGEITTRSIPKQDVPEGFATQGFNSVIAMANLRLVEVDSHTIVATFVEQASGLQMTTEAAEMAAMKNIAVMAGQYFVKQLAQKTTGGAGR